MENIEEADTHFRNPQRLYAEHRNEKSFRKDIVRTTWRHVDPKRNQGAPQRNTDFRCGLQSNKTSVSYLPWATKIEGIRP